jgi:hypothetical protein
MKLPACRQEGDVNKIFKVIAGRQPSPLYVPIIVTVALLVTIIGCAATIWNIAQQRERWAIEDDRNGPRFRVTISNEVKQDRFRFGQMIFINTMSHDYMQLVRIEAVAPSDLIFTEITNPARWTLRGEPRRILDIPKAYVPPNGTYSMIIMFRTDRTPNSDQGQEIELVAEAIDLSSAPRTFKRSLRQPIPIDAAKAVAR